MSCSCGDAQQIGQQPGIAAHPRHLGVLSRTQLDLGGVVQPAQPALGDEALVDRAHAALEGGPHRGAEGDGLAVHGAAGADHEVGVGDQRLGVDRALGHDEPVELGALLGDAGQDDRLRPAQAFQDVGEHVVPG